MMGNFGRTAMLMATASGLALAAPSAGFAQGAIIQNPAPPATTADQPSPPPVRQAGAGAVAAPAEASATVQTAPEQVAPPVGAGPQASAEDAQGIGDIVVTAQRQSENAQRTPIAIAVVTGEALQQRGISNVSDFVAAVPAVTVKSDFGTVNPNIYIRGVGSTDFNANVEGAVGVYIDDIVQSSPAGQLLQFFDNERVEVLRGPQGTLYGRNTTAGTVNIISRKPTDELKANAFASYGRFNDVKLEAGVGGPIVPGLLQVRVAGIYQTRDGNIRNSFTGPTSRAPDRLNNINTRALRGQLRLTPAPDVDILYNVHMARSDTTSYVFQHRGLLDPNQPVRSDGSDNFCPDSQLDRGTCVDYYGYADKDGDPWAGAYGGPSAEKAHTWGTSLKADIGLGGGYTFTSISGYENVKRLTVLEVDESPNPAAIPYHNALYDQYTQEVRLASPTGGALRWQIGGFYFRQEIDFNGEFEFNVPRKGGTGLAIAPRYNYRQTVDALAGFGQAYLSLTDRLTLTAGLRYSHEVRRIDYRSGLSLVPATVPGYVSQPGYNLEDPFKYQLVGSYGSTIIPLIELNGQTRDPLRPNRLKTSDVSWRIALDWQATDNVLLFASNSRGTKAGGFNGSFQTSISQNVPLAEERLTAYEVGFKSDLLDRRLRLNGTVFYYDYQNLQTYILGSVPGVNTPAQSPVNVNARNYGGELELLAKPIEPLTLSLSVSYLNAEVTGLGSGGVIPVVDVIGNKLPLAPEWSGNGSVTYQTPLAGGTLTLGVDGTYADASTSDITNTPRLATDSYFLLGARAAWRTPDERWEFAAFGRNVLNERYISFVANIDFLGYDRVRYGDQATYGLSASFRF